MKSDSKETRTATSAEPEERTTTQRRGLCTQRCEERTRKWHAQKTKQANNTATYTDRKKRRQHGQPGEDNDGRHSARHANKHCSDDDGQDTHRWRYKNKQQTNNTKTTSTRSTKRAAIPQTEHAPRPSTTEHAPRLREKWGERERTRERERGRERESTREKRGDRAARTHTHTHTHTRTRRVRKTRKTRSKNTQLLCVTKRVSQRVSLSL